MPRPRRRPRLKDDRRSRLVPGVANRDARKLFDVRFERLQEARGEALENQLAEARALGLWRGRSLTGFAVFVEQFLSLALGEAREKADAGEKRLALPGEPPASEEAIAAWYRAETALLEAEVPGRVRVVRTAEGDRLVVDVATDDAARAWTAIGRRLAPLARDQER